MHVLLPVDRATLQNAERIVFVFVALLIGPVQGAAMQEMLL